MIEFHDVAVCYDPQNRYPINALESISLKLKPGDWTFVVGPSGVGKSTLLKLVYAGAHATRGRVIVDGQDITHLPPHDIPLLRRKIGVIFQDFQLLPQKTVWENVAFALQVIGAPQKRLVRDVPRALETVGLTYKSNARPHELSGGEQQRVAIARAIVNNPGILLADEPTGNLDPQTAADIAHLLERINERGTTILMATHDRALVDAMRQRVVRIADGRIISDEGEGIYHAEDDDPNAVPVPQPYEPRPSLTVGPFTVPSPVAPYATVVPPSSPATAPTSAPPGVRRRWDNLRAAAPGADSSAPTVDAADGAYAPRQPSPSEPRPSDNGRATSTPRPSLLRPQRGAPDSNLAPLGSPDNPIVQFGPTSKS